MRRARRSFTIVLAFIGILAIAATGAITVGSTTQTEPQLSTTDPLSAEEMMTMLATQTSNEQLASTEKEPGKIYRWDDVYTLNAGGRFGFILISQDAEGTDTCLIDFDRNGSIRQTIAADNSELFLQVYQNTNCSGDSYAGVVLVNEEGAIEVESLNDAERDRPYVEITKKFVEITPNEDPEEGTENPDGTRSN